VEQKDSRTAEGAFGCCRRVHQQGDPVKSSEGSFLRPSS
jgi:hypothetical protein